MSALTQYAQKKLLDHTLGIASYTMPVTQMALFTSSPDETGSTAGEVVGGSYARVTLTGLWTATVLATGIAVNAGNIQFATPSGTWGTVTHWGVCETGGGNVLVYGALNSSRLLQSGSLPPVFLPGALTITARSTNIHDMTRYLAKKWLDHILGIAAFTPPAATFLGLSSSDPGGAGSLAGEIVGGSYARQSLAGKMGAATLSSGESISTGQVTFPTPTGAWNARFEFVADAVSAGNVLWRHTREQQLSVVSGSPAVRVTAGAILVRAL